MALFSTAAAAATLYTPAAISQDEQLSEIVVTGSRIRRVETETASPVFIVNREAIEASGVTTMGELLQQIPTVSGAATNTSVNNGGGDGASTIELRGLGEQRTLVLLNGRRMTGIADNGAVDVNLFPVNLIERVDVLKEGAGAIYGTDAIGGVVNFVTREDVEGLELTYDYGVTSESDGKRHSVGIAWGTSGDRGNVVIGANYNQQDQISAGDRDFADEATYFYGSVFAGGSSRTPGGRIRFTDDSPLHANNGGQFACDIAGGSWSVTKLPDVDGTGLDDYRCFDGRRPLQLPAAQSPDDAAGAREPLHVRQLQRDGRDRDVCGTAAQLHDFRLPARGAAFRFTRRQHRDPGQQLLQPVRPGLWRTRWNQYRCRMAHAGVWAHGATRSIRPRTSSPSVSAVRSWNPAGPGT